MTKSRKLAYRREKQLQRRDGSIGPDHYAVGQALDLQCLDGAGVPFPGFHTSRVFGGVLLEVRSGPSAAVGGVLALLATVLLSPMVLDPGARLAYLLVGSFVWPLLVLWWASPKGLVSRVKRALFLAPGRDPSAPWTLEVDGAEVPPEELARVLVWRFAGDEDSGPSAAVYLVTRRRVLFLSHASDEQGRRLAAFLGRLLHLRIREERDAPAPTSDLAPVLAVLQGLASAAGLVWITIFLDLPFGAAIWFAAHAALLLLGYPLLRRLRRTTGEGFALCAGVDPPGPPAEPGGEGAPG